MLDNAVVLPFDLFVPRFSYTAGQQRDLFVHQVINTRYERLAQYNLRHFTVILYSTPLQEHRHQGFNDGFSPTKHVPQLSDFLL